MKQCRGTVVFDIDGVLLDFYDPFLAWYNQKHGTAFRVHDLKTYDIASGLSIDPQEIVDFHADERCHHLPLVDPSAVPLIQALSKAGYQIVLNTDFPPEFTTQRHANLAEHGVHYDAIHFRCKERLASLYDDIVLVAEDNPKWIRLYAEQGMKVVVPERPYLTNERLPDAVLWYDTLGGALMFPGMIK